MCTSLFSLCRAKVKMWRRRWDWRRGRGQVDALEVEQAELDLHVEEDLLLLVVVVAVQLLPEGINSTCLEETP